MQVKTLVAMEYLGRIKICRSLGRDSAGTSFPGKRGVRDSEQTNIPFYISSSGHLCRPFNHKILDVALLCLRFCSIRNDISDPNPSAKPGISVYSKSLKSISFSAWLYVLCILSKWLLPGRCLFAVPSLYLRREG